MRFVVMLLLTAVSWACSPTTMQTMSTVPPQNGRRKRSIEEVIVTVTSNKDYDEAQNELHLKVADAMLEDIASSQGVQYNKNDIVQKIKNENGKFAVQYSIFGADCYAVRNFVSGAKNSTAHFGYATVECEDGKYLI